MGVAGVLQKAQEWVWLVSCRKHRILIQGLTPDLNCELNIRSFLTLPHPLHYPICVKDIMITVLLLQVMRVWVGGGSFMLGFGWGGTGAGCHNFSIFCSVFMLLFIALSWLVHDSLFCLVSLFLFCILCLWSLLIRHY